MRVACLKIVLFLGFSEGGKTTALTAICRAIARRNLGKVGSIKRIHEKNFSIDSSGKDTFLHAESGSSVVMAVSPRELDIISKRDTSKVTLKELIGVFKRSKVDYLLVEGLHQKFEKVRGIKLIICAKSESQAKELLEMHKGNIVFITGKFTHKAHSKTIGHFPVLTLPRDNSKALSLIGN